MLEKGQISNRQAGLLLIATVLPTSIFSLPAITAAEAKEDAWLSVIIASVVGVAVILTVVMLGGRFPGKTPVEYSEAILGKILGKVVGLIYIGFFLYLTVLTIREFSEFMLTVFMDDMPPFFISGSILLVCAFAVYHGLEVIGRLNEMMIIMIIGLFLLAMLLATGKMLPFRILPLFAEGIIPVLKGSLHVAGRMGEVIIFAFLLPYMNQEKLARRTGLTSVLMITVLLLLTVIPSILTFGALETARLLFPNYMVARTINFPDALERVESIFMLIWVIGAFTKITVCYYVTLLATGQWLNLGSYRFLVLPIATVLLVLSFLSYRNISELIWFLGKRWAFYSLSIALGIQAILLIITVLRRKGVKSN